MHLEILLHDFNKLQEGKSLRLVEIGLNQINESPLKGDEEESYFIEGVFPLIKDEKYANKSFLHIEPRKEFIKNEERIKMPGSDWLYLRIYGANQRLEEFLKLGFLELISKGKNDGWMDHAFFMRYRDPEYHIRLRIHGEAERIITEGMKNVYDWADELKNKGLLSHIEIGTYDPEIERYGGPQLINAAEELFSADSEMTAQFLSLKRFHQYHISEEVFGVINVVDILSIFFPDFEDQLSWLNRSVDYRNYKKEYQKYKEIYLHYANDYNNWQGLRTDELGKTIYELLEIRRGKLIAYAEKVHTLNNTGSLYNNIDNIIGSLIHLHLNRLIGMDREKEEQIITVARHTLHNLRYSKQMLNSR
ncbi:hypothetical protein BN2127_JRS1_04833 [Bacillus cereus]|nr:hypothetical protein BN2127_JRS1_04833 [Bacillus cereus]